ncbi:MAG: 50S ribosomal protein L21 [Candidatus Azosocius agrarius]|nr:MAG: 50S ribosomal protein L21 [Gammaproteobacteria bacterium]
MYAVVSIGGRQYKVFENQIFKIDKLGVDVGSEIEFTNVLVLFKDNKFLFGKPYIVDCKIKLYILNHDKEKKINIIKFRRRKHYMKKIGFRSWYTQVKVLSINSN